MAGPRRERQEDLPHAARTSSPSRSPASRGKKRGTPPTPAAPRRGLRQRPGRPHRAPGPPRSRPGAARRSPARSSRGRGHGRSRPAGRTADPGASSGRSGGGSRRSSPCRRGGRCRATRRGRAGRRRRRCTSGRPSSPPGRGAARRPGPPRPPPARPARARRGRAGRAGLRLSSGGRGRSCVGALGDWRRGRLRGHGEAQVMGRVDQVEPVPFVARHPAEERVQGPGLEGWDRV